MNEKAEQAIAKILEQAANGVEGAAMFGKEHLPDVVQQLLMWHMIESLIAFFIGLSLIGISTFLVRYLEHERDRAIQDYANGEKWTRYMDCPHITSFNYDMIVSRSYQFGAAIPATIGLIITFANPDWLQIMIAPKLYVLEYAANMVS